MQLCESPHAAMVHGLLDRPVMRFGCVTVLVLSAACSSSPAHPDGNGIHLRDGDLRGSDDPGSFAVTGVVSLHAPGSGATAAGVTVACKRLDDDSLVGSTTTDAGGSFSIQVLTSDGDVYLDLTRQDLVETFYNYASTVYRDTGAAIDVMTPDAYTQLFTDAAVTPAPGTGVIEVDTLTQALDPGAQASVSISPPSGTVAADGSAQGRSYVLNASTGSIDAMFPDGAGDSYSREIRVFPDKLSEVALHAPFGGD